MVERPASVVVLRVLAYLGLLFLLVAQGLVLGAVAAPPGVPADAIISNERAVQLWLGQLPLAIVIFAATWQLIRVATAVLEGNTFTPETLHTLRRMARVIGLGGTVGAIILEQVTGVIGRQVTGSNRYSFTLPLGWIVGGLVVALMAAIVAEGVRRSGFPQGSYAGPAGPPPR